MKLLLDQGLPRSASELLNEAGVAAVHVSELGLSSAEDIQILQLAKQDHFTVVTLDADFHTLLALSQATSPSVIRIRIEGLKAKALTSLLLGVIDQCGKDLENGMAVTVEPGRIRIHNLPLL